MSCGEAQHVRLRNADSDFFVQPQLKFLHDAFVLAKFAAGIGADQVRLTARFWRVVDRICGHVERAKRWLDTHGNDLHRYGIED